MLLAIGVFDGVHLGHEYLLAQLTRQAKQQDVSIPEITFHRIVIYGLPYRLP